MAYQDWSLKPEAYDKTSVRVTSFGKNVFLFFSARPLDSLGELLQASQGTRVPVSIAISLRGQYRYLFLAYLHDSEAARGFEEFLASLQFR